jgi:hypothetical protein
MDDNFLKLVKINIERHPNAKMCISKMTGTILYLKCSNCKTSMSKKCACLCSCGNNDISRNNDKLPSSSDFKKVNNLTNPEGLILHKSNPVQCLELAKLLVLENVYSISKQYSLIWSARSGAFYQSGTSVTQNSSYVVLLRRQKKTFHIGISRWDVKNYENEYDNSKKQQPQQQQQQRQLEIMMDETYIVEQNVSADGENYPKTNY